MRAMMSISKPLNPVLRSVRACPPARQPASPTACPLPACPPARLPACLGVLDAHMWNASSMRGGHVSPGSARTCTTNACHRRCTSMRRRMHCVSPPLPYGNVMVLTRTPKSPPLPYGGRVLLPFLVFPGRPWKKRQVSRAPGEVPAAPGNCAWRSKQ
jgi:hypothetical protein